VDVTRHDLVAVADHHGVAVTTSHDARRADQEAPEEAKMLEAAGAFSPEQPGNFERTRSRSRLYWYGIGAHRRSIASISARRRRRTHSTTTSGSSGSPGRTPSSRTGTSSRPEKETAPDSEAVSLERNAHWVQAVSGVQYKSEGDKNVAFGRAAM
jgi:hypothetical protein